MKRFLLVMVAVLLACTFGLAATHHHTRLRHIKANHHHVTHHRAHRATRHRAHRAHHV